MNKTNTSYSTRMETLGHPRDEPSKLEHNSLFVSLVGLN